jgi:RNA polymerase sigma-70 factor (ECF subfamily)
VTGHAELFAAHRALLFTIAYEVLGSTADADDVVQESWLRWADVDLDGVRDPRAYLVQVVTRQALNRLRTVRRRREEYVGPWLPGPLVTAPEVVDDTELAEAVSVAMLVVLEALSPLERAVFVLREVFGLPYDEIAAATGRSVEAARQLGARARRHVDARRPRFDADADVAALTRRFLQATATGDLRGLMDLMAPDVVLVTGGGGKVLASLRPIQGPDRVARFFLGVAPDPADVRVQPVTVNGQPGVALWVRGALDTVATARVVDGKIVAIYVVRNPDKLARLAPREVALA